MEIPRHVFKLMREEFKELEPLFYKFVHSHINPPEIEAMIKDVDTKRATGELAFHEDPYDSNKRALGELKKAFREVGAKKFERIRNVYEKCNGKWYKSFMKAVRKRSNDEIWEPEVESSWRDFTSIYPDKFDGDNIAVGNYHSCKFHDIKHPGDPIVWSHGHVCHSIQALTWRICGLYKEFSKEPDVIVSEDCRVDVVEEMIRLSHYVMDMSTIVHLMKTSTSFHNNFEVDLDNVVDEILPNVTITINRDISKTFKNDAYGEADKRAKKVFEKNYFEVLDLYGVDNSIRTRAFSNDIRKDLAEDMIKNASQNLADFWMYALDLMNIEQSMYDYALNNNLAFST
jgi:hypothetical protein